MFLALKKAKQIENISWCQVQAILNPIYWGTYQGLRL